MGLRPRDRPRGVLRSPSSGRALIDRRAFVLGALALAACSKRAPVSAVPKRVVSLSPSTTEALFAIGAGALLVGRSRYCDFPPEVANIPSVGGYADASYEAVLGLAPDLVIGEQGPGGRSLADRLSSKGIGTYFPPTASMDDIDAMVSGLGARVSKAPEADAAVAKMRADRAVVTTAVSTRARPSAVLLFGLGPIVVAGPIGFGHELLTLAGAENAVARLAVDRKLAYPTIGFEELLALDPDVLLHAAMEEDEVGVLPPAFAPLRAVKAGRVIVLRDETVLRPGPRIGQGLRVVARAIHPEAFP